MKYPCQGRLGCVAGPNDNACPPSRAGYRFLAKIISFAVWLYVRFPLSLRHVNEVLAACGITVSHD